MSACQLMSDESQVKQNQETAVTPNSQTEQRTENGTTPASNTSSNVDDTKTIGAETTIPSKKPVVIAMQPNHFHITLAKKDPSHPQFGVGHDMGFAVNGTPGKEIVVERGQTYYFDVDTNVQHDFYLSTNSVGWGSGVVTTGIRGQFTYKGIVTYSPDKDSAGEIYYQCRNHKAMGWKIHVVNKGEKANLGAPIKQEKIADQKIVLDPKQIDQKIQYAMMLVTNSGTAKRIQNSTNDKAKAMLKSAEEKIGEAKTTLKSNQLQKSKDLVDEALRLISSASTEVPALESRSMTELEQEFDEYLHGIHTFKASYDRTYERAQSDKKGRAIAVKVDMTQMETMITHAKNLRASGKLQEANQILHSAQKKLTSALNKMLASQTVVYDLKFDSHQEEYEYEVARFESYVELVPLAIERKQPVEGTLKLMQQYTETAKNIRKKALEFAKKSDYKTAIEGMQEATNEIRRALRLVGV